MTEIRKATLNDLPVLVPLFDAYRVFYEQDSDEEGAHQFIQDRIQKGESTIFIAWRDGKAIGFTQLYPTFSSVSMKKMYILNDLYVINEMRGLGIGKDILNYCQQWAKEEGYKGLSLETAVDNPAQKLYEREGWSTDEGFLHYFWSV